MCEPDTRKAVKEYASSIVFASPGIEMFVESLNLWLKQNSIQAHYDVGSVSATSGYKSPQFRIEGSYSTTDGVLKGDLHKIYTDTFMLLSPYNVTEHFLWTEEYGVYKFTKEENTEKQNIRPVIPLDL